MAAGAASSYEEEQGIQFSTKEHTLQMCWTVSGNEDFRQALDDVCMGLNELAQEGAAIEVTFYDAEFEEEDGDRSQEARDDFVMLFVGPNPAAIMKVQRDMLVQDVIQMMERHFEASELVGVVSEIDKLFTQRFDSLLSSLDIGKLSTGGQTPRGGNGGHRPRHLH